MTSAVQNQFISKPTNVSRIRNIGIIAHIDAGKTTVSERILFVTGKTHRIGEVHHGSTTLDWMDQERKRGITITSAATTCSWNDYTINLVDTPGHVDFTIEVARSLRVLDGAVAVFDGVAGVEPQSETVWRQAARHEVPVIALINKLDRSGANVERTLTMMATHLGTTPLPLQLPFGIEDSFEGVIDLLARKLYRWGSGTQMQVESVPAEFHEALEAARSHLVDKLVELDDELATTFLEEVDLADSKHAFHLVAALRRITLARSATPVLLGAALRDKGVQPLLDAIIAYLPSPEDKAIVGQDLDGNTLTRLPGDSEPLTALAFKSMSPPGSPKLTFVRVYAGTLLPGMALTTSSGKRERPTRIVRMHADRQEEVAQAGAGMIVALTGLKETRTGDSLFENAYPMILEAMEFPEPVMSLTLTPQTRVDGDELPRVLASLVDEDPSLHMGQDPVSGATLVSGMGELHLDVLVTRLGELGVQVKSGAPQVAYKETVSTPVSSYSFKLSKQTGGAGQFAHVIMSIAPRSSKNTSGQELPGNSLFVSSVSGGDVPKEFIAATMQGVQSALSSGVFGHPVVDVEITLEGGSIHPVDSSEMAFRKAGEQACKELITLATPVILEPIMALEVLVPEEYLGSVMGEISRRRGTLGTLGEHLGLHVVNAEVPLSEMFGFNTTLLSTTSGRGSFHMELDSYQPKS